MMQEVLKQFDKLSEFMAAELLPVIITNLGEEAVDNNQRLYDMACDLMQSVDLNVMVLNKLRKALKVK